MKKILLKAILLFYFANFFIACNSDDAVGEVNNDTPEETITDSIPQTNPGTPGDTVPENPAISTKLLKRISSVNEYGTITELFTYNADSTIYKVNFNNGTYKQYFYDNGKIQYAEFFHDNGQSGNRTENYNYSSGIITSRTDMGPDGVDESFLFTYNSQGIFSGYKYIGSNEPSYSYENFLTYDGNNNISSILTDYVVNTNFNYDYKTEYLYDDKHSAFKNLKPYILIADFMHVVNNPVKKKEIKLSDNSVFSERNYAYTYDEDNFPITRITTDGSGNVTETTTFEYYDN